MPEDAPFWRIAFRVPGSEAAAKAFEDALEPFCQAVSRFPDKAGDGWRIDGWARPQPDSAALAPVLAKVAPALGLAPPEVSITCVPPRDWLIESLKRFPPVTIGRFFVYGSHRRAPVPPGRIGLCLDPGAAFGSGEHATTAGCLRALDLLARRRRFRAPLDLGCGSGILALAMAATWRVPVVAADVDPRAVAVARANARRNRLSPLVRVTPGDGYRAPLIRRRAPFDLIVANILANPLCRWAAPLSRHLERGGITVLSGFLGRDGPRVLAAHRRSGLRLIRRIEIDGWQTLVLGRDGQTY